MDEQVKNAGNLEIFTQDIYDYIKAYPSLITSREDVDLLIKHEHLWPALGRLHSYNQSGIYYKIENLIQQMNTSNGIVPKYEPTAVEEMHHLIIKRLKDFKIWDDTPEGKYQLWKKLTQRGVSPYSDQLFEQILDETHDIKKVQQFFDDAKNGNIWESNLKKKLWLKNLGYHPLIKAIRKTSDEQTRFDYLVELVNELNVFYPEKGHSYLEMIEKLSWFLETSPEEARYLRKFTNLVTFEGKTQDAGLRALSSILDSVLDWSKKEQWNMILFLRGEIEATPHLIRTFGPIGPVRVQRMFQTLPHSVRTTLLDTFFDDPKGLLSQVNSRGGNAKMMIDHLLAHLDPTTKKVGTELLESFIFSLMDTQQTGKQSQVLSYLLALPPDKSNRGEIIKRVLESFGTSGVKIGQFLAATELLPEGETAILRDLQERANPPLRDKVNDDFSQSTGAKYKNVKFYDLKGAASIKYAIMGKLDEGSLPAVYKFLREDAIFNTPTEFKQLKSMANYLRKKGPQYGIIKAIVNAAEHAVLKELSFEDEVNKSRIAREQIYPKFNDDQFDIQVPNEKIIGEKFKAENFENYRVIESEFAPGVSIEEIKDPEIQRKVAAKILGMEGEILFADQEEIYFDPDRHAGNYRIDAQYSKNGKIRISPIDFGQLISITSKDRQKIVRLFALGQIAKEVGPSKHMARIIGETFNLNTEKIEKLFKNMKDYFPNKKLNEPTAYFSILSALDDSNIKILPQYFDFMKSLVQLNQYLKFVKGMEIQTPFSKLKTLALEEVENLKKELLHPENLTRREKLNFKMPGANPSPLGEAL